MTLSKTLYMEELIRMHGTIMDQYDPEKKIGMMVDEWGTWYDVEPGTNPGFLYQQNSIRDALVAALIEAAALGQDQLVGCHDVLNSFTQKIMGKTCILF